MKPNRTPDVEQPRCGYCGAWLSDEPCRIFADDLEAGVCGICRERLAVEAEYERLEAEPETW